MIQNGVTESIEPHKAVKWRNNGGQCFTLQSIKKMCHSDCYVGNHKKIDKISNL